MGRALASALLDSGHQVTVWNRTASKAEDLTNRGAILASSPAEALHRSALTVFCVLDDDVVASVIEQVARAGDVRGLTVVNLTADSPSRTRALADELHTLGVTLLDGAIMTPAASIGTDAARVLYSGSQEVYETHRDLFAAFGGSAYYLGNDIAAAATYDAALLSLFWTSFVGVVQALALARAEGVDAEDFTDHAVAMGQLVVDLLPDLVADFAGARYAGADSATIDSLSASLIHLHVAFAQSEISTGVLDAISSVVDDAKRAGHGEDDPIRLAEPLTLASRAFTA